MILIVDRIEGTFAVCENEECNTFNIPLRLFERIREGDCITVVPEGFCRIISTDEDAVIAMPDGESFRLPFEAWMYPGEAVGFEISDDIRKQREKRIKELENSLFE